MNGPTDNLVMALRAIDSILSTRWILADNLVRNATCTLVRQRAYNIRTALSIWLWPIDSHLYGGESLSVAIRRFQDEHADLPSYRFVK